MSLQFQTRKFLTDHFGNHRRLHAFLEERLGEDTPNPDSVYRWFTRNSMPHDMLALVLLVIEEEKTKPANLARYFKDASKCARTPPKSSPSGAPLGIFG